MVHNGFYWPIPVYTGFYWPILVYTGFYRPILVHTRVGLVCYVIHATINIYSWGQSEVTWSTWVWMYGQFSFTRLAAVNSGHVTPPIVVT